MLKQFTCIMCPMGCALKAVIEEGRVTEVTGNTCPKGLEYAVREVTAPMRNIATSVLIEGGELPLASVRLTSPIPKGDMFKAMKEIRSVCIPAPVRIGQVVIKGILGTESDVIITKNVDRA